MAPAAAIDVMPSGKADTESTCSSQYALSHLPDYTVNTQHADGFNGPATADEWEIPRSMIDVGIEVSRGSYGQVFRGQLKLTARSPNIDAHRQEMEFEGRPCLIVAVKMLRSNNSVEESKMFSDEIDVMKKVSDGSNPHVLQMIGCVTTTFPMMLIFQFVPNGSLKDYLRSSKFATSSGPADATVHCRKFTSFGYQIASGMEFLTAKQVIHRDLACRDVLVGDNELLKICDFGLARETLDYISAMKTRLPIRWMAPETFLNGHFSEKSDVWAYGVCLWEIFSIGAQPYEGTAITAIPARILAGHRLECPEGCPEQIHSIMTDCWNDDKEARPTFQEIKEKIDGLISHEERYNYLTPDSIVVETAPTPAVRVEPASQPQCSASSDSGLL